MTIDLTEVSHQVRGFYNSGITTGYACAQVAYKCLTSPTDYPINDGSFRSLKAIVPPGRVVSAVRPAPMRWWMTFPMTIVDTVFKALARRDSGPRHRRPSRRPCDRSVPRHQPQADEFFIGNFGPLGGGWGAKRTEDGVSGTVCINDGDTHNSPNEQVEAKFPIVVERYALRAGFGRRRPSSRRPRRRARRARAERHHPQHPDRARPLQPVGARRRREGTGNDVALRLDGTWKADFPNAKVLIAQLKTGDAFRLRSGGGGGYGSPFERPVAQVQDDVRQGYVSAKEAGARYGVAVDPQTFEVDEEETARLRAR